MKQILLLVAFVVMFFPSSGAAAGPEIIVRDQRFVLPENWKLADGPMKAAGFSAVWINPKTASPNAAIIAKALTKSVTLEADEMAASVTKHPGMITLLEDRVIAIKGNAKARIVSLEMRATNELLGIESPMVFHSIYLPTDDGKSITVKLQCAKSQLADAKAGFETAVLGKQE